MAVIPVAGRRLSVAAAFRNLTPHTIRVVSADLWPVYLPNRRAVAPEDIPHHLGDGEGGGIDPSELYFPPWWEIQPDPAGPARVAVAEAPAGHHDGIPLSRPSHGEVTGLPEPVPGVLLIVSRTVQQASPREDLVVPTGLIRDEAGRLIGCTSLGLPPARQEEP